MLRRWVLAAVMFALAPRAAHAREREARAVVRVTPAIPSADAARLVSAIRAQLRETATLDLDGEVRSATCVVDVDRSESGIVLRFTDASGRTAGPPRVVMQRGEIGASEAATIIGAFVIAEVERAAEKENDAAKLAATARTGSPAEVTEPAVPPSAAPSSAGPWSDERQGELPHELPPERPAAPAPALAVPPARGRASSADREVSRSSREQRPWRARLAALYTGVTYASELRWQSGARLEGAYAFFPGAYGGVTYAFHPPAEIANDAATVRVSRHSGAVFVGIESSGRPWVVGADAAVGLDDTSRSTSRTSTELAKTADAAHVAPIFALRLHGRWRVPDGRGLAIDLAPTFELAPGQNSLVIESNDTITLLDPALARFRVDVGATFDGF